MFVCCSIVRVVIHDFVVLELFYFKFIVYVCCGLAFLDFGFLNEYDVRVCVKRL